MLVILADVKSKVNIIYFKSNTNRCLYMSSNKGGIIGADGSTLWLYHRQKLYNEASLVTHVNDEWCRVLTVTQTEREVWCFTFMHPDLKQ